MEFIDIDKEYTLHKTPRIIYHYTSSEVLIKIFENKQLRFTNCMFLNDKDEYKYFKYLIQEIKDNPPPEIKDNPPCVSIIDLLLETLNDDNEESLVDINNKKYTVRKCKYYVFCGSLNNDSLPMWNYYVKNNNFTGYSIGIDIQAVKKALSNFNINGECYIGRIIYKKESQIKIISNYIHKISNEFDDKKKLLPSEDDEDYGQQEQNLIDDYQDKLFNFVRYMRLFFKSKHFSYEKEYRIVVLTDSAKNNNIKKNHSVRNGIIVPSVDISFDKDIFKEVIISPTMEEEICYLGLKDMLSDFDFSGIRLSKSSIKIR